MPGQQVLTIVTSGLIIAMKTPGTCPEKKQIVAPCKTPNENESIRPKI
jgi:hypothetical protein